ncbi:MAG: WD40/YVTN/BNR-like repeat-containing protein [Verrucomicrobiales bacterium]
MKTNTTIKALLKRILGTVVIAGMGLAALISAQAEGLDSWQTTTPASTTTLRSVTCYKGSYVATTAEGALLHSSNRTSWTPVLTTTGRLYAVFGGNGIFIAAGDGNAERSLIYTSTDGQNWTRRTSPTSNPLYAIAYGSGRYVIAGHSGAILHSTDAVNWTQVKVSNTIYGLTYAQGKFVAVGRLGDIFTSTDGISWIESVNTLSADLKSVTYGKGRFVAIGERCTIATSVDGYEWQARELGTTLAMMNSIEYEAGHFVAAGDKGTIIYSSTGSNWTVAPKATTSDLYDVTYSGSVFLAVGENGARVGTGIFLGLDFPANTNGKKTFDVKGHAGAQYQVQKTTDLKAWNPISTFTGQGETVRVQDPQTTPNAFYRLVLTN